MTLNAIRSFGTLVLLLVGGCNPDRSKTDTKLARDMPPTTQNAADWNAAKEQTMDSTSSIPDSDLTPLPPDKVRELASKLEPHVYAITQEGVTEPAFTGTLLENKEEGVYACYVCGLPLFSSEHKFKSGTGWPSFYREIKPGHVAGQSDDSLGMARTEITCARCGSHLGHVFDDGPQPTGLRHCVNSAALAFQRKGDDPSTDGAQVATETAYFAGGCFWGVEHYFQLGPGVIDAVSGYMQGNVKNPTYEAVCSESTGHAETVKVVFDPKRISFRRLLQAFFDMHDATQLNRQGPDHGTQYRSGIWYASDHQKREAQEYVAELQKQDRFKGREIVTKIDPADTFWPAEDYHQDYIEKTGRACHVANPWD